ERPDTGGQAMTYTLPNPPLAIDAGDEDTPEYPAAAFRSALSSVLFKSYDSAAIARTGALDRRSLQVRLSDGNVEVEGGGYAIGTSTGAYLCAIDERSSVDSLEPADPTNPRTD